MAVRRHRPGALPLRLLPSCVMAAILVGIIGVELREATLDEVSAPIAPVRRPSEELPAPSLGTVSSDQAAGYVAAILARPLFSPNRRPDAVASNGTAKVLARLAGVMVSPAGKSAIFASPSGGKPVVVGEGGRIGEYAISSIEVGAVTVTGPTGERVLHPAFDPNPPPPVRSVTPTQTFTQVPVLPKPAEGRKN